MLPPAPKGGFPATYPNIFAITNSIDDNLKAPYSMNLNFSIGREFGHGFFVQGSYVGRLSRHSLMQRDLAMPTNLRDPKSGQTYFQAMSQLATQLDMSGVSVANLPKIPFFENLWATAAGGGFTATQAVAKDYLERSNPGDFTNVLNDMDNVQACSPTGSTFSAAGKDHEARLRRARVRRDVESAILGALGVELARFRRLSLDAVDGPQTLLRRDSVRFELHVLQVDRSGIAFGEFGELQFGLHDQLVGSEPAARRLAVRRAALRERASWSGNLPFGRGAKFGHGMNRVLDAFVGGWQIAGTYRQTSGLPFSIGDGSRWATNWELSSFAVPNGQAVPATVSVHNTPAAGGGPNLWLDPKAALGGFQEALAGQTGSRNTLRGDGFFDIDSALSKSFSMPWSEKQKLSFRWEAYNVTNSVRFDPNSASVSLTTTSTFGRLERTARRAAADGVRAAVHVLSVNRDKPRGRAHGLAPFFFGRLGVSMIRNKISCLAAAFCAASLLIAQPARRALKIDDMHRFHDVRDAQISPDGKWVAYTVNTVDAAADKSDTDVWIASWDGKQQLRMTTSTESESAPRWSPDGRWLSFLSSRPGKAKGNQVWLLDRNGGEAQQFTDVKGRLTSYDWSPDGKKLLLVMADRDPSDAADDERPGGRRGGTRAPRRRSRS